MKEGEAKEDGEGWGEEGPASDGGGFCSLEGIEPCDLSKNDGYDCVDGHHDPEARVKGVGKVFGTVEIHCDDEEHDCGVEITAKEKDS